ncbi:DNA primase [hydrothermal vent metagenome]|uniref:DNA primase n=1 Tax=hydrothermal vent metagenome TaxID=652676 RepID=A0A160V9J8_9ZZZZ
MTVVDDIKGRLDILEVVSRYVPLQRSGRSHKAPCPFHQEKTPSFFVFPERQSWRCFGACATGGDVFSFVMRSENMEFGDALKHLAQQTGVELPNLGKRNQNQGNCDINESARIYFQELLASAKGTDARAYLDRRGVSAQAIEKFELGLSPSDGESLKNHLVKQGFSLPQLNQAGIVRTSQNGWNHDLFRSRLMFPIRNGQGGLGGFGARALDDSQPKYLNSPRTPVFDKGHILYGLHLAKESARQEGIVIVEGYMDAVAAHQEGFNNVVASMGTALTENQVAEIRRLTKDVTMALDADVAGQQATLRSLESSWRVLQTQVAGRSQGTTLFQRPEMLNLKIAVMPEGMDPDDLIHRSPDEWTQLIQEGPSYIEYLLKVLPVQLDASTPQGKAQIVSVVLPSIQAVPEPFQQDHYFQMLADQLGVTRETLQATIDRPGAARQTQRAQPRTRPASGLTFTSPDGDPLEEYCLTLLLHEPDLEESAEGLQPEYFRQMENREIFNQWVRVCQGRQGESSAASLSGLVEEELTSRLDALLNKEMPPLDPLSRQAAFRDVVIRLESRYLVELKAEEEIRFSESSTDIMEGSHLDVLEINQRIKMNQNLRNSVSQESTARGK